MEACSQLNSMDRSTAGGAVWKQKCGGLPSSSAHTHAVLYFSHQSRIIHASVAFAKKHNVESHFQTIHGTFAKNYPENSEIRKKKQSVFVRPLSKSKNATTASFKIDHLLARKNKTFQDGESLKEAFLAGAESLFEGFSDKREIISAIQELHSLEPVASLFVNPITIHHEATETATTIARIISSEVGNLELEIVDLKNDVILQAHATDVDFWKRVEKDRFPLLRSVAYKIKSCFGSTYLCESLFSTMNIIKSKNRSRLTDSHLESSLRAGTSACVPNMQVLVDETQCKKSH
ncbi:hypothetical protein J437_LFUL012039 [Ladona fulva]|uniref:HAT C-terminal dimerisation domain-containing protein n=1 Tax=Ladona fulva TaxID=123851 RepID=A0A8K0KC70_LADFU|nr:hypothetical protein J437_LFUL012039 [Ladona fulva]